MKLLTHLIKSQLNALRLCMLLLFMYASIVAVGLFLFNNDALTMVTNSVSREYLSFYATTGFFISLLYFVGIALKMTITTLRRRGSGSPHPYHYQALPQRAR